MDLLDRRLLIVGGKGGTGKSSVAAALGQLAALSGKRTLVVAADGSPGAAGKFGVEPTYKPTIVERNLTVLRVDTRSSLDEFVALQLGPLRGISGPVAAALGFVAEAAPGVAELLLVGKYAHEVRTKDWDLVVVDAASSGHLLGELAAPTGVNDLASVGRLARETGWMVELLGDPEITGVVNVTLAEEVPFVETLEFVSRLHVETPAHLGAVVVNRTRPQLYTRDGRAEVESLIAAPPARMSKGAAGLLEGVQIGIDRADVASEVDARLRRELSEGTQLLHVPDLGVVPDTVVAIREALHDELNAGSR
ncbi:MAG: ArsA-related P-loop ATPase [Acidimicrobiales bacterium]